MSHNKKHQNSKKYGQVIIFANTTPWPQELHVARILALAGHTVEFIPKTSIKSADILLDGIEYEIKSPITNNPKKIIRNIKRALKQSRNVIIDASRIKNMSTKDLQRLLIHRGKDQKTLKRLLLITKHDQIIDIFAIV